MSKSVHEAKMTIVEETQLGMGDVKPYGGDAEIEVSNLQTSKNSNPKNAGIAWNSILCTVIICLGSFVFGEVTAYTSPAMNDLNNHRHPFSVNDEQNSWVGSVSTLGALVGGLLVGTYMDLIGRKLALMATTVPFIVGWVIIAGSPSFACLLVGRVITGFCMGIYSGVCPVFISEISPASIRGFLGTCPQLILGVGILYTYGFGAFLSWQWLAIACGAVLLVLVIAACFIPDSPRWFLSVGKLEEAEYALQWLRRSDDVSEELKEVHDMVRQSSDKASLKEFLQPELLKPLLIGIALMVFQQFSGINVILYYIVDIFKTAHIDLDPNLQSIIVGIVGIVGTTLSVFIIDLGGRRILLLVSAIIMTPSIGGLGAFFYELDDPEHTHYASTTLSWLPVTCLVVFYFGYNLAYGAIPWLMMGELFPLRAKGTASSIVTASSWLFAFFITKFFVNITDAIGRAGAYWIFTAFCALSVPFVFIFVPETKGKTLEQIVAGFK